MDCGEKTREQISSLADGELEGGQASRLLDRMSDPELRAAWDRYHQVGDAIRSEDLGAPISADFSARLAARLDAEPVLLAPKRAWTGRLRGWSAAVAAVAAAAVGFFVAPGVFEGHGTSDGTMIQIAGSTRVSHGAIVAEASGMKAVAQAGVADYIRLHQSAHPALYGTTSLARPVVLDDGAER